MRLRHDIIVGSILMLLLQRARLTVENISAEECMLKEASIDSPENLKHENPETSTTSLSISRFLNEWKKYRNPLIITKKEAEATLINKPDEPRIISKVEEIFKLAEELTSINSTPDVEQKIINDWIQNYNDELETVKFSENMVQRLSESFFRIKRCYLPSVKYLLGSSVTNTAQLKIIDRIFLFTEQYMNNMREFFTNLEKVHIYAKEIRDEAGNTKMISVLSEMVKKTRELGKELHGDLSATALIRDFDPAISKLEIIIYAIMKVEKVY